MEQALEDLDYKLRIPIVLNIYGEMDLADCFNNGDSEVR